MNIHFQQQITYSIITNNGDYIHELNNVLLS